MKTKMMKKTWTTIREMRTKGLQEKDKDEEKKKKKTKMKTKMKTKDEVKGTKGQR